MTLFFFEIFSLRFIQHYSNPDIAPYEDTNIRLLRSRERVRALYLFYKYSTSREVVALHNDDRFAGCSVKWIKNPEFRVPPKFGMTNVVFDRQPQ